MLTALIPVKTYHPSYIREALGSQPTVPSSCSWATFLRLHDEVDLSGLSPGEREECFDVR